MTFIRRFFWVSLFYAWMPWSGVALGADATLSAISFPPGNYQDFSKNEKNAQSNESPPTELKVLETSKDFQKVTLPSESIKIKIPLGWKIYTKDIQGKNIVFETPAGDIRGNVGWYPIAPKDFKTFQGEVVKLNQEVAATEKTDNQSLKFSAFQLPNKGFGVQWANRWMPHPKGGTLADFAATIPQDISMISVFLESTSAPTKAVRLILVSKTNQLDPLLKLMGLMVRDLEF